MSYKKAIILASFLAVFLLSGNTASASSLQKHPNNLGLVSYWSFDEGTGTSATDFSGHGYTGTFVGTPTWINGKRGKALSFPGTTHYVTAPDSSLIVASGDIAISVWIYASSGTTNYGYLNSEGGGTIISRGTVNVDWILYSQSGSLSWRGAAGGAGTVSCTPPSRDAWHHVILSQTGTTATMYIDGVQCNSGGTAAIPTSTGGIAIGTFTSPFQGNPFLGYIDEVRIYNRTISSTEAATLYAVGTTQLKNAAQGLVGYWPFNEGAGTTAVDKTGQGNDGTLTSGPTWVNGKYGKAVSLDGVDDYVGIGALSSLDFTGPFTLSAWTKLQTPTSPDYAIVSKVDSGSGNGYMLWVTNDNAVRMYINGSSRAIGSTNINDNQWHFVTAGWDGSEAFVYVDGSREDHQSYGTAPTSAGQGFYVGWYPLANRNAKGLIDDVRVYKRALTPTEIANLYASSGEATRIVNSSQNTKVTNGLVGLWSFDGPDLTTTTSTDRSGQGHNGTLVNGPVPAYGVHGQALSFDGTNDEVALPKTASVGGLVNANSPPFAISAWFKTSSATGQAIYSEASDNIIGRNNVTLLSNGKIRWTTLTGNDSGTNNDLDSTASTYEDGSWHHVVAVYDGSAKRLYIDGVADTSFTTTLAAFFLVLNVFDLDIIKIGRYDTTLPFNGLIDDVRIYNRALSAAEVLKLYNAGK